MSRYGAVLPRRMGIERDFARPNDWYYDYYRIRVKMKFYHSKIYCIMCRTWHFNKFKMEMKTRHFLRSARSCVSKVRISSANLWNPVSLHLIFKADFSLTRYWKSYQLVPSLDSKSDCTLCLTDPTYNRNTGLCPSRIVLSENYHHQNIKLLSKLTN